MSRVEKVAFAWLVAMLAGVAATGAYVAVEHGTRCTALDVTSSGWRQSDPRRNTFAHRVVQCHLLDGFHAGQVRAALGRPRERSARAHGRGARWTYDAGVRDGFMFPAPENLELEMSSGNVVERASIAALDD